MQLSLKIAFFSFVIVSTFISCINDMNEVNQTTQLAQPSIEKGKDVEFYYSEDGHLKIRIKAPVVTRFMNENPYIEFNNGLVVDFFNDNLEITSNLKADYGIRYEKELKTIVRNNVVVVNEKKETLHTEELTWDEKKHIIFTDKQVIIQTATDTIFGEGMEADETMTRYKILKPGGSKIKVETETQDSTILN